MYGQKETQYLKRSVKNKFKAMGNIQNTIKPTAIICFIDFF